MDKSEQVTAVLASYAVTVTEIEALEGAGGFSGARFWKIQSADGPLCLRRWPAEHPTPKRLQYIHSVLARAYHCGVTQIALPRHAHSGATFVSRGGHLWELSPWMPGQADYHRSPSHERLAAAMRVLARFHAATAKFDIESSSPVPSRGIHERLALLDRLVEGDCQRIAAKLQSVPTHEFARQAGELLFLFQKHASPVRWSLSMWSDRAVDQQPCLRDIWHDHLLFTENRVTGLIDFGAVRGETPAADVARLLVSLARGDQATWQAGLAEYEKQRVLSPDQRALVEVFRGANILLSGMNWLRWIYLENRQFENRQAVAERLDENLANLRQECNRSSPPT